MRKFNTLIIQLQELQKAGVAGLPQQLASLRRAVANVLNLPHNEINNNERELVTEIHNLLTNSASENPETISAKLQAALLSWLKKTPVRMTSIATALNPSILNSGHPYLKAHFEDTLQEIIEIPQRFQALKNTPFGTTTEEQALLYSDDQTQLYGLLPQFGIQLEKAYEERPSVADSLKYFNEYLETQGIPKEATEAFAKTTLNLILQNRALLMFRFDRIFIDPADPMSFYALEGTHYSVNYNADNTQCILTCHSDIIAKSLLNIDDSSQFASNGELNPIGTVSVQVEITPETYEVQKVDCFTNDATLRNKLETRNNIYNTLIEEKITLADYITINKLINCDAAQQNELFDLANKLVVTNSSKFDAEDLITLIKSIPAFNAERFEKAVQLAVSFYINNANQTNEPAMSQLAKTILNATHRVSSPGLQKEISHSIDKNNFSEKDSLALQKQLFKSAIQQAEDFGINYSIARDKRNLLQNQQLDSNITTGISLVDALAIAIRDKSSNSDLSEKAINFAINNPGLLSSDIKAIVDLAKDKKIKLNSDQIVTLITKDPCNTAIENALLNKRSLPFAVDFTKTLSQNNIAQIINALISTAPQSDIEQQQLLKNFSKLLSLIDNKSAKDSSTLLNDALLQKIASNKACALQLIEQSQHRFFNKGLLSNRQFAVFISHIQDPELLLAALQSERTSMLTTNDLSDSAIPNMIGVFKNTEYGQALSKNLYSKLISFAKQNGKIANGKNIDLNNLVTIHQEMRLKNIAQLQATNTSSEQNQYIAELMLIEKPAAMLSTLTSKQTKALLEDLTKQTIANLAVLGQKDALEKEDFNEFCQPYNETMKILRHTAFLLKHCEDKSTFNSLKKALEKSVDLINGAHAGTEALSPMMRIYYRNLQKSLEHLRNQINRSQFIKQSLPQMQPSKIQEASPSPKKEARVRFSMPEAENTLPNDNVITPEIAITPPSDSAATVEIEAEVEVEADSNLSVPITPIKAIKPSSDREYSSGIATPGTPIPAKFIREKSSSSNINAELPQEVVWPHEKEEALEKHSTNERFKKAVRTLIERRQKEITKYEAENKSTLKSATEKAILVAADNDNKGPKV